MIVPLENVRDASIHGGKALALARLMQAGLPVPAGFVLDESAPAGLAAAPAIALAQGRPLVVRSSAAGEDGRTASFAGQLESMLGVDATNEVEAAIERCRASRRSTRVAAYERARGVTLATMGVIVQRQIDARFAGVLFTRRPDANGDEEMLCEFCEGLGDRLVQGEISPGRVALPRAAGRLRWERELDSGARPDAGNLSRLATAGRAAERLFGCPQDIEWAIDMDGYLWLLQSRPITTPAPPRTVLWSNANVNENFPEPISPFLYSIAAAGYTSYFTGLGRAFGVSAHRLERLSPHLRTIIGVQAGRMYYNLASIHAVLRGMPFGARLARWFDDFVGAEGPNQTGDGDWSVREVLRIAARTTGQYLFLERRVRAFEACVDAYAARTSPPRLGDKSLLELRDDLRAFLDIRLRRWTDAALADAAAMATYGALKSLLARWLPEENAAALHHGLLRGLDDLASAAPVEALWQLARLRRRDSAAFEAAFADYLERWGFRFSGELMLTEPSFQERPGELRALLDAYAAEDTSSPAERLASQKRERLLTTRRVLHLAGPLRAAFLRPFISAAQAAIGYRERARLKQALLYSRLRRVALAIGERLVCQKRLAARDDVFFLTAPELDDLLSGSAMFPHDAASLVALRRESHAKFASLQPADVLRAREGEYPSWEGVPDAPARHSALRGSSVCGGKVTGRARVLTAVQEARTLAPGDILVTRQTDPGWAPVFVAIGGLVLERGGMLSHGAILAREYGIPTLVGVSGATTRITDGVQVELDGDEGVLGIVH